jgi:hypothetical protein
VYIAAPVGYLKGLLSFLSDLAILKASVFPINAPSAPHEMMTRAAQ